MKKQVLAVAALIGALAFAPAQANDFGPQIQAFFDANVKSRLGESAVVDAVKEQNAAHAGLTADNIDALDKTWRAEAKAGGGDLVDKVLSNELSKFLSALKAQHPDQITEVFVMDNRGLNVGQSDVTSDYNQGDEGKWQKTYAVGPDAVFIDEVEFDESTESFQSQVSATIVDPATGAPIGAITLGLNVENLL